MTTDTKSNILLVDDTPDNLTVLEAMLAPLEENVVAVRSGDEALRELLDNEYSLVVLDVHMPELNGYQVAQMIRKRTQNSKLPIIFVSAVFDTQEHMRQGFEAGGTDYLTRPFAPSVFRGKVRALLELHEKHVELEEEIVRLQSHIDRLRTSNAQLERLESDAASNVVFKEAMMRKSELLGFAAHELMNPLAVIGGSTDLLLGARPVPEEDRQRLLEAVSRQASYMREIVNTFLETHGLIEASVSSRTSVGVALRRILSYLEDSHPDVRHEIRITCPGGASVATDPDAVNVILMKVIGNALKYTRPDAPVDINVIHSGNYVAISVANVADAIDPEDIESIFAPFMGSKEEGAQLSGAASGLHIATRFVQAFGGSIVLDCTPENVTFTIHLPEGRA